MIILNFYSLVSKRDELDVLQLKSLMKISKAALLLSFGPFYAYMNNSHLETENKNFSELISLFWSDDEIKSMSSVIPNCIAVKSFTTMKNLEPFIASFRNELSLYLQFSLLP